MNKDIALVNGGYIYHGSGKKVKEMWLIIRFHAAKTPVPGDDFNVFTYASLSSAMCHSRSSMTLTSTMLSALSSNSWHSELRLSKCRNLPGFNPVYTAFVGKSRRAIAESLLIASHFKAFYSTGKQRLKAGAVDIARGVG